ncbi:MAG: AraC family transcriptional regulator [Cellulosilyticaceae bacterium]
MLLNIDAKLNLSQIDLGMKSFTYSTQLSTQFINHLGDHILYSGTHFKFCNLFQTCLAQDCPCIQTHLYAGKQSLELGEPYVFMCPTGLTHIAMAVSFDQSHKGTLLAGPFLMHELDELIVEDLYKKYPLPDPLKNQFSIYLASLPCITPQMTRYYAHLLGCIASSIMLEDFYNIHENQMRLLQQRQINEHIQYQKHVTDNDFSYPYTKEKELLYAVKSGDTATACSLLNDLLGHIFFSHGQDLSRIKPRVLELCTILSRAVLESTGKVDETLSLNALFLDRLTQAETLDDLSFLLQKIIRQFSEEILGLNTGSNSTSIRRAISYIHTHYGEAVTLSDVASYVNLNISYFSTIFKKETGSSFSQYLNLTRIEHSKLLLNNTELSILDIALEVGFDTDSYFCTVFKKLVGVSPKQYKQQALAPYQTPQPNASS